MSTGDRHIIDEVWEQINAMASDPRSWRRFRILEIYCRTCDEPIAEVMRTNAGSVVVYRTFKGATFGPVPMTGKPHESQAMAKKSLRMLADGGGPFICFCKCSRTILEVADLTGPIKKGQRRVVSRRSSTSLDK